MTKSVSFMENVFVFAIEYTEEERCYKSGRPFIPKPKPKPPVCTNEQMLSTLSLNSKDLKSAKVPTVSVVPPPRPLKNFSMSASTLAAVYGIY